MDRGTLTIDEQFADSIYPAPWSMSEFRARGWEGFERLVGLPSSRVPDEAGVYVIMRPADATEPVFTESSALRGDRAPLHRDALVARWVVGARVLYIGKAAGARGLRQRVGQFARMGSNHAGGRSIWQLRDHAELVVGWFVTPDDVHPALAESALLSRFRRDHNGSFPFANI